MTVWTKEGRRSFREACEKVRYEKERVNEMMEEIVKKLNQAVTKWKIETRKWKLGMSKWWDKECTLKKKRSQENPKRLEKR